MKLHFYVHFPEKIHVLLETVSPAALAQIHTKLDTIMADLTELTAEVAETKTVSESAITLLNGLKAQLDAAGTDPVKLKELSDSLDANSKALAAAVEANTPAA